MKQTKCSSIRTDSNSAIMVFTYPDDKTGLEGDTKVEIEIGGKTIELTESQLNVISNLYKSSLETRRNKYYTESIEREEYVEDMGQSILSPEIARGPWPHETCGCRPPENALPPYWTCFKCDSTWTYLSGDIEGWSIGV